MSSSTSMAANASFGLHTGWMNPLSTASWRPSNNLEARLMAYIDFILRVHNAAKRNYVARVTESDKAACATISKQFGFDYFDGDRKYGYGGFLFFWRLVAVGPRQGEHDQHQNAA